MNKSQSFQATFLNIFQKYSLPPINSNVLIQSWHRHPMQFWQNHLNFAVWCATTGCGVSFTDHLSATNPMIRSLYRYHMYYQTRRILKEMGVSISQETSAWNPTNNTYNCEAYERICDEFNVSYAANWNLAGPNDGLGQVYFYVTNVGYMTVFGIADPDNFDSRTMSFTELTSNGRIHVDYEKTKFRERKYGMVFFYSE